MSLCSCPSGPGTAGRSCPARIAPSSASAPPVRCGLSHRGQINGELRDFLLVGVSHHQHHAPFRIDSLRGESVYALRGVPSVALPEGGALVLYEARPHRLGARKHLRGVEAGEIDLAATESNPEGERALGPFEHALHVAWLELLALEGGVAGGEGQAVKRGHHGHRLPRGVLDPPLPAEFFRDDALLTRADRLLAVAVREGEGYGFAGRGGDQPDRQHQERKTPTPGGSAAHADSYSSIRVGGDCGGPRRGSKVCACIPSSWSRLRSSWRAAPPLRSPRPSHDPLIAR